MCHQNCHVVVSGVRLAYLEREVAGGKDASPILPAILLLHALLATAETLTELIAGLSSERRIVAIDLLSAQPATVEKKNWMFVRQVFVVWFTISWGPLVWCNPF